MKNKAKKKFGVYFEGELIDTIEAETQEEAEEIAYEKIEKIPSQLKYKGKTLYENDEITDDIDEAFDDGFCVKPLKKEKKDN